MECSDHTKLNQNAIHPISDDVGLANIAASTAFVDSVRIIFGPCGARTELRVNGEEEEEGELVETPEILTEIPTILSASSGMDFLVGSPIRIFNASEPTSMICALAQKQHDVAGDGSKTAALLAGSMLSCAMKLLWRGISRSRVCESFELALEHSCVLLRRMARPIQPSPDELIRTVSACLEKDQHSVLFAQVATDAVFEVIDVETTSELDLETDVHVTKVVGSDKMMQRLLVSELCFLRRSPLHQWPALAANAKIAVITFQLSPPPSLSPAFGVLLSFQVIDRIVMEQRRYLLKIVRKIRSEGCTVLLIQESILRDAVTDCALRFLAKMKIMVVKDIPRRDIKFVCKTLNVRPIDSIESFSSDKFATAAMCVEETSITGQRIFRIEGIENAGRTVTVLLEAPSEILADAAEKKLKCALTCVQSLLVEPWILPGGGAAEMELSWRLQKFSRTLPDAVCSSCFQAYAESLEAIPEVLAENAELPTDSILAALRRKHREGGDTYGVDFLVGIGEMAEQNIMLSFFVFQSALKQATETAQEIIRLDK